MSSELRHINRKGPECLPDRQSVNVDGQVVDVANFGLLSTGSQFQQNYVLAA